MSSQCVVVTVVIPTFNRAQTILRSVRSVLDQSYSELELIVVDDGSTDDTEAVLQKVSDPRLRLIKLRRNRGQSFARNVGVRAARGELVAFQDSDDFWLQGKLERQVALLRASPDAAGAYCDLLWMGASGAKVVMAVPEPVVGNLIDRSKHSYQTLGIGIQSCVLRKAVLAEVGGFSERMHCLEDLELLLRIVQRWRLCRIPEALVHYFESNGVSKNVLAKKRARRELLRLYGQRIAFSDPTFIAREFYMAHRLRRAKGISAEPQFADANGPLKAAMDGGLAPGVLLP